MQKTIFLLAATCWLWACSDSNQAFKLHRPHASGLDFVNLIEENEFFNIMSYEYIYNGGGVAVADFNQDGLQDLFFTGNMVGNKLYLNQGDFKFKDVSATAGIEALERWSTGVAVTDLNEDGLPDLYVCASTLQNPEKLANMLFVNKGLNEEGIPTFSDEAKAYGIADEGFSTNAVFFDYDKDNDLDLYVLTNKIETGSADTYRRKRNKGESQSNDRLYRNDGTGSAGHPTFTEVTQAAGIVHEGYGLGINVADINLDGWPDIYVGNDYITNDLLYINNQDGTFTNKIDQYIKHQSHYSMGNDIADINNDALPDIITVDMLPMDNQRRKQTQRANNFAKYINNERLNYEYQYPRNMLQLNQGKIDSFFQFSEVGCYSGIYATDWSWTALLIDLDNDSHRDLYITNGFPKDITNLDFAEFRGKQSMANKDEILAALPSAKLPNYTFQNNGNLGFINQAKAWGLGQASFSNGAVHADLDNDGDLDLVVNNIDEPVFLYENKIGNAKNYLRIKLKGAFSGNSDALGAKVKIKYQGQQQYHDHSIYRGYLSSVEPYIHFGLGDISLIDTLEVSWPNGERTILQSVGTNQVVEIVQTEQGTANESKKELPTPFFTSTDLLNYEHEERIFVDFNIQRTLPHMFSQSGPAIAIGDIDGNGTEDCFFGGSFQLKGRFFVQENGQFTEKDLLPDEPQEADDMGCLFFDADQDGDLDLYIASGGHEREPNTLPYQDRFYQNDGNGNFEKIENALPEILVSSSCVRAADYDQDGDLDLFVGGRVKPGFYPQAVASYILRNDSENEQVKFSIANEALCPDLNDLGLVSDALWTDFDDDKLLDLVIVGEWMPITFLKNTGQGFENITTLSGIAEKIGWWNSLTAGDFDNDGDTDYVAGNLGLNSIYQANGSEPVIAIAKDFDDNGGYDVVMASYQPDLEGNKALYPMHAKDDLIKQMVFMKKRFLKFESYASAKLKDLFTAEELEGAQRLSVNHLSSSYIENLGGGKFQIKSLPTAAQMAPIFGMVAIDANEDEYLDVLIVGNAFGTDLFLGRYDALNGLLLKGSENGFIAVESQESGFYVPGDAKALSLMKGTDEQLYILASQNQDELKVFEAPSHSTLELNPQDARVLLELSSGKTRKVEAYYGHSFLSQSSRIIPLPANTKSYRVFDFQAKEKTIQ